MNDWKGDEVIFSLISGLMEILKVRLKVRLKLKSVDERLLRKV
jgi:hypothetical protein